MQPFFDDPAGDTEAPASSNTGHDTMTDVNRRRPLVLSAVLCLTACAPGAGPTPSATNTATSSTGTTTTPPTAAIPVLPTHILPDPRSNDVPSRGGARIAATGTGPLTGRRIVLDPGHNGSSPTRIMTMQVPAGNGRRKDCQTSGTANRQDHPEHAFTWDVTLAVAAHLRAAGAELILTRPSDTGVGPCVDERAAIGNRARADAVVSIHADGSEGTDHRGYHVITSPRMAGGQTASTASVALATALRTTLDSWGKVPRSTYIGDGTALSSRDDLAGLNLSTVPAAMIECGNMMHPADDAILDHPAQRQSLGAAIARGIVAHLRQRPSQPGPFTSR